jgi:hypothetical protein
VAISTPWGRVYWHRGGSNAVIVLVFDDINYKPPLPSAKQRVFVDFDKYLNVQQILTLDTRVIESRLYVFCSIQETPTSPGLIASLPGLDFDYNSPIYSNTKAGLFVHEFSYNAAVCDTTWCPFAAGCLGWESDSDAQQMTHYCSLPSEFTGLPNLYAEENCVRWQQQHPKYSTFADPGSVVSAREFCQDNPEHPSCLCYYYADSASYKNMRSMFQSIPNYPQSAVMPPPVCWAEPCTAFVPDGTQPVLDGRMRQLASTCPDMQLTFCNQIIEVVGAGGTVNIDNNTFYQVCGQNLPGGSKGGSAPNSPIKWIRDNLLAFIAIVLAGLLVIGALAWIARTLFRRRTATPSTPSSKNYGVPGQTR